MQNYTRILRLLSVSGGEYDGLPNVLLPAGKTKRYRQFLSDLKVSRARWAIGVGGLRGRETLPEGANQGRKVLSDLT